MIIDDIRAQIWEDTNYTVFPQAIDTIDKKYDVDVSTKPSVDVYHDLIGRGDFEGANTLLQNNPALAQAIWRAIDYNRIRDAVLAMERTFNDYIVDYIVHVTKARGTWNSTTEYQKFDMVLYTTSGNTQAYFAMPQNESVVNIPVGTLPTNTTYWVGVTGVVPATNAEIDAILNS